MEIEDRLSKLERRHSVVVAIFSLIVVCLIGVTSYQAYRIHGMDTAKSLRLRELRIYDEKGVDRVVLSGQLPQPTINGKPHGARSRSMAGLLIYDGSGTERGGYGTANGYANAMFTLDAKDHQVVLMLAEPDGGAFFRQWEGNASITMGVDDKPFLTLKDNKDVVFAKPENNPWVTRALK